MWVYEETVDGRKLTDIINSDHENVRYMPGIKLPPNIVADPDVVSAAKGASVLIFVLPHQFLGGLCKKIVGTLAPDCIAISLVKAVHFDETGIVLISDMIKKGLNGMDVSVLMGANLAVEVARGAFCETTIGLVTAGFQFALLLFCNGLIFFHPAGIASRRTVSCSSAFSTTLCSTSR